MLNSPYISLNDAAKLTGRAKSTISKALKSGKMSYVSRNRETGAYEIDQAEALRVFPQKQKTEISDQRETLRNPTENSILQVKLEAAEQRIANDRETIEDLRRRLDEESAERRKLMAQITDQTERPKGFFRKLFG